MRKLLATGYSISALSIFTLLGSGNFHEVEKGKVYRSGQLPATVEELSSEISPVPFLSLEQVIQSKGIKSIINFRGRSENSPWYPDEIRITKKYGVAHYDVGISAQELPKKERLLELFSIFDSAPYPILMHCKAGADRSGLGSAIYQIEYNGVSVAKAMDQLATIPYFHFPYLGSKTRAMGDFLELFNKTGNGKSLRQWVIEDYQNTDTLRTTLK